MAAVVIETLAVDSIIAAVALLGAVADGGGGVFLGAEFQIGQTALGIGGGFRDDIDDAIDRVGAPDAAAGAADDFDALDVFEGIIDGVPIDARKNGVIDRSTVDLHE